MVQSNIKAYCGMLNYLGMTYKSDG